MQKQIGAESNRIEVGCEAWQLRNAGLQGYRDERYSECRDRATFLASARIG